MKAKNAVGKIYVGKMYNLGRSETFCREFCRSFQTTICQIEHLLIFLDLVCFINRKGYFYGANV